MLGSVMPFSRVSRRKQGISVGVGVSAGVGLAVGPGYSWAAGWLLVGGAVCLWLQWWGLELGRAVPAVSKRRETRPDW